MSGLCLASSLGVNTRRALNPAKSPLRNSQKLTNNGQAPSDRRGGTWRGGAGAGQAGDRGGGRGDGADGYGVAGGPGGERSERGLEVGVLQRAGGGAERGGGEEEGERKEAGEAGEGATNGARGHACIMRAKGRG